MARDLGKHLPEAVVDQLRDGSLFAACDRGVLLLTVDGAGFPHVAVIPGVGVRDQLTLLVPCHRGTSTFRNLDRTRLLTVVLNGPDLLLYVKARVQLLHALDKVEPDLCLAECTVESVLDDRDPEALIRTGITYNPSPDTRAHVERMLRALQALG